MVENWLTDRLLTNWPSTFSRKINMHMDCSSCDCLCRNGNVRWITVQFLRFCSLATKSPLYITCNAVDSSNEILERENQALYFSASILLLFVVFQFGKNCVNATCRRKYKNFELYLFLLFGNCRSGFLVNGPEKNFIRWRFFYRK